MSRSLPAFGLVLAAASSLAFFPSAAEAQKGLVYCPVSIDATGCGPIVTALTSSFPGGVETGYDGSSGTVDLATADLSAYAVLVVPSLADGAGVEPYGLLRDPAIAARLSSAFTGRSAVWSGTPDHGSTNRAAKDALLRNLAGWAKADGAGRGAGIVALQDNSDDAATRYGWLSGISSPAVAADTTFEVYSNVQTVTSTGQTILNNGGLQIGYTNMASYGLVASGGAGNDATGGRTSRVVLVTKAGETSASAGGLATVVTDKEDYQPGDTVNVAGTGWEPGETVSLLFHEDADPPIHPDKTYTAVADADGHIFNHDYEIDELDLNVRFTLEATGLSSGKTAQTTFTDAVGFQSVSVGPQTPTPIAPAGSATYVITLGFNGNNSTCIVALSITTTLPTGVSASFNPVSVTSTDNNDKTSTLTISTTSSTPTGSTTFNVRGVGSGCNDTRNGAGTLSVKRPSTTTVTGPASSSFGQSVTFTATVTGAGATPSGTVQFKSDGVNLGLAQTLSGGGTGSVSTSTLTTAAHSITADYSGDANYTSSTSPAFSHTVNKANQTISFTSTAPSAAVVGGPTYTATATATSGLVVTFSSLTAGVCTTSGLNGSVISFIAVGAGTCTVAANQAGNTNFNPAPQVTQSFAVGKGTQTIAFTSTAPTAATVGGPVYTVTATGGASGNPVLFSSSPIGVCTSTGTNGATITMVGAGTCTVAANQAGNADYNAAIQKTQIFTVSPAPNVAPVGNDDNYSVNEDQTLTITAPGVLGNDTDANGDALTAQLQGANGGISNGTLTFAADGSFTYKPNANFFGSDQFMYRANDGTTTSGNTKVSITVNSVNDAPSFTKGADQTAVEGSGLHTVTGWATAISAGPANESGQTLAFQVTTNTNAALFTVQPAVSPTGTLTYTLAASGFGSADVTLVLKDNGGTANGGQDTSPPQTFKITVTANNQAPVVDAGGPYTGDEGSAIPLNTATATDPDAGDTPTYKWTYVAAGPIDLGTTCSFSNDAIVQPSFTCNDDGSFTVTLTVNDGHSHIVHDDAGVTVNNVKPTAAAGGPYTDAEGTAIQLAGSGDDPGNNDDDPKLTYLWTVNTAGIDAGGTCTFDDATKKNAKVTCTDNSNANPFTLTLVATDDDGASSTGATTALTVTNAEPVADAGGPYNGNEGSAISLNGTVTDVGSNDTHTWSWAYVAGPGVDAGATCTFSSASAEDPTITCTDDGTVELTFTATDDNGGTGSDKAALTVKNVAPVAHAGGPYTGKEGEAIGLDGSATDAGTNDGLTYKWTVDVTGIDAGGACTFDDDTKANAKVTCTDNSNADPFKLKLVATDDDGASSIASEATLTVANADPVADAGGGTDGYSGDEGSAIPLNGSATDPGSNDTFTWSWEYVGVNIDAGATCAFSSTTVENPTVTCTDNGEVKLTLTVTDDNGGHSSDDAKLTVKNVAPVAHAGGTYTTDEGSAVMLNGSATDAGSNDVVSYKWTADVSGVPNSGSCVFDNDTKPDAKVTCNDNGTVKLTLKATDDDGGSDTDEATLTVKNVDPVADAGGTGPGPTGTYSGDEGSPIQLTGSATDVGSNDTFTWAWEYTAGDGFINGATCAFDDATAKEPKITCNDNGTVKLTLTVTDDDGGAGKDYATLNVKNVDPVANAGGGASKTYTGDEGSAIQLYGSATDAGSNDTFTWAWEYTAGPGFINGATCQFDDANAKQPKITCNDNGIVELKLTVADDDGGKDDDAATLTVKNVNPVATAGAPSTGDEGSAILLTGSATDAGANDVITYKWTADVTGITSSGHCTFDDATKKDAKVTCDDNGALKLTLTATDDDGGVGTDVAEIAIANVDPVANAGGGTTKTYSGNEGSAVQLYGSATDAGSNDTFEWSWQFTAGDGFINGATCSFDNATDKQPKITCNDNGTVKLTLTVTDDDGGEGVDGATLNVANVAPVAHAGGPYTAAEGEWKSLNGSATDVGTNDTFTYLWTVTPTGIDAGGSCSFDYATKKDAKVKCTDDSNGGKFTLTLVATDDDGGVSVASTADLTVTNANPVAVAGGPYSGNEGAAISLTGSKSDAGSNDTHTYLWTYAVVSGVDAGATCSFSSATVLNPTITCTDDGSYKVTLTVTDDDLGTGSNDATLTLQNVKPTIASLTKPDGTALPTTIIVAGTLPIKVSFSDPATNDTHTAQIDCGLGYVNIIGNVTTGFQTSCTFATIGPKTIKVKVTDDDAGYDEKSLIMTVKYLFDGFYAPVDRPNTMNLSKAGQAIPLKWRLTNALGAPITDLTGVTVQAVGISCGLSTTTDQIEEYAAGASGLQNQGNGNYQFNWKTPSTYANSCKSIALVFGAGGTSYTENPSAYFTFKP